MLISPDAARAYLERSPDANLMLLAALAYDPVRAQVGVERGGALAAAALVVELGDGGREERPTIMVAADDAEALGQLVRAHDWPLPAVWSVARPDLLAELERLLGRARSRWRGVRAYVAASPPQVGGPAVRSITLADADALDLAPCSLGPTALRNWLRRGWRMFGVVQGGALVCHALAAYPVLDTEEVSAVFTAPRWRRRGLARAVVAATIGDIVGRGRRAVYVAGRSNIASQAVAEGLGMAPLFETWEIVTG
ncbi:MAG: GNAT family N-acetyltransferase [Chloroflexota bacterium]